MGSGGHATVSAEILMQSVELRLIGCISNVRPNIDIPQVEWLGHDHDEDLIDSLKAERFFVGIGDNETRARITSRLQAKGFSQINAISRSAYISKLATLSNGIFLGPATVLNAKARIGEGAIINSGSIIEHHGDIGAFVHIAPGATIAGSVRVGDFSIIGAGAVVLPGVSVGKYVSIGAGAVVTRDVRDNSVAVGVPARVIRSKQ